MLFINSARPGDLDDLMQYGLFNGVTTNPQALRAAGLSQRDIPALYDHANRLGAQTFFAQAVGGTHGELRSSAEEILELGLNASVKIPATPDGLRVVNDLQGAGERILLTAVYHPAQGVLAHELGLGWIAPYVGKLNDLGVDGVAAAIELHRILTARESETKVLAASIRSLDQMSALFAAGIPAATLGPEFAHQLLANEHSIATSHQHLEDAWAHDAMN
ncbi:transaldolase family protein [Helcobacillus massiliensis]|uniref:transaldolase family protein n=1 Tax=Helcobacillus massiliensis TaxID=521392 RepID=UPI002556C18D|nr:transaldolase family protein [Helcobacillus massiliensis]MDK7742630.1 transaldolase family protein [Helcobacillus massiliensis]WOO92568.1 transaldolase family protein [Helcobacillus massiliensis]